MNYKIDFNTIKPEVPFAGIEHWFEDQESIRVRLVEYRQSMEPHWCEKGHYGIMLEGKMDMEFSGQTVRYKKGDGIFLPPGKEHKHKAIIISDIAKVFFIEFPE